MDMDMDRQM
jgi:hypothetical protein